MAVLGSEPDRFARYEAQIAEEYAAIAHHVYCFGRIAFFKKVRDSPCIFLSDFWRGRLEERARSNIEAAVRRSSLPNA